MGAWQYFRDLLVNVRTDWLEFLEDQGLASSLVVFLDALIGVTLILMIVFPMVILFIWLERRFLGFMQLRPGPNWCGPFGLLQPIADAIKFLIKEIIIPAKGEKLLLLLAPAILFASVLMIFAVIPIGAGTKGALADLNIGVLYIVAIGSVGVFGIFMAGWGSANKWSMLGAMRAIAQLVSYEVPMVLSIVGIILIVGSLQISEIVGQQSIPFILLQPLGFLIYFLGALTELNRSSMDQVEADSELTSGYFTEYSGMRFATFFLAEYINAMVVSCLVTTLFLSGWKGPGLPLWMWFVIKMFAVFVLILWLRGTLIRIRIDQIMAFAWKFLLPVALINIFMTAGEVLIWDTWMSGWQSFPWPFIFVNWAVAAVLIALWAKLFFKLGGGRVEVGEIRDRHCQGYGLNPPAPVP
jgi:NADH-quinone oxidoreductase subunit H